METDLHVTCVQRSDSADPHARIVAVGGRDGRGEPFRMTHEEAVDAVRHGRHYLWFEHPEGHETKIVVARGAFSHYYLKGEVDLDQPDSLLELPDCPPAG